MRMLRRFLKCSRLSSCTDLSSDSFFTRAVSVSTNPSPFSMILRMIWLYDLAAFASAAESLEACASAWTTRSCLFFLFPEAATNSPASASSSRRHPCSTIATPCCFRKPRYALVSFLSPPNVTPSLDPAGKNMKTGVSSILTPKSEKILRALCSGTYSLAPREAIITSDQPVFSPRGRKARSSSPYGYSLSNLTSTGSFPPTTLWNEIWSSVTTPSFDVGPFPAS
mmetsp:Transcript_13504/g.34613  ORF Transcript_13504/g.34613 Transcript_13504/m.34613 type:complete len:225 (+) Transcript_13504:165-839(+)